MLNQHQEPLAITQQAVIWHTDPVINRLMATTIERDWGARGQHFHPPGFFQVGRAPAQWPGARLKCQTTLVPVSHESDVCYG